MPGSKDKTQTNKPYGAEYVDYANSQAQGIYKKLKSPSAGIAPTSPYTTRAMKQTAALAQRGIPGLKNAFGFSSNMLANNGMTADMTANAEILKGIAAGNQIEDPRLQQMLDANAERAANAAATRFGGGRYGSAAIGNGLGSAVADANNATMLQSNENARGRQLQASGLLGQMYDSGAARAFQAGAMLPTLNNLQYDPASRLAGVGDFYTGQKQARIDNQKEQLNWYNGIINGNGRLGGSTTTPGPSRAQSILGGAATGGALLGPLGAIGGGILGAFG